MNIRQLPTTKCIVIRNSKIWTYPKNSPKQLGSRPTLDGPHSNTIRLKQIRSKPGMFESRNTSRVGGVPSLQATNLHQPTYLLSHPIQTVCKISKSNSKLSWTFLENSASANIIHWLQAMFCGFPLIFRRKVTDVAKFPTQFWKENFTDFLTPILIVFRENIQSAARLSRKGGDSKLTSDVRNPFEKNTRLTSIKHSSAFSIKHISVRKPWLPAAPLRAPGQSAALGGRGLGST